MEIFVVCGPGRVALAVGQELARRYKLHHACPVFRVFSGEHERSHMFILKTVDFECFQMLRASKASAFLLPLHHGGRADDKERAVLAIQTAESCLFLRLMISRVWEFDL